jgi:hypothetical protein
MRVSKLLAILSRLSDDEKWKVLEEIKAKKAAK